MKLLHEAAGHVVTVELKTGEVYRGSMIECEDNWNCQIENITFTAKDGKVSQLEHVFIRGSRVRFMIIPDMLKNAPMFKRLEARIRGGGHHHDHQQPGHASRQHGHARHRWPTPCPLSWPRGA